MAFELSNLLQSVIPAGLSGLGAAGSAIWAFFRELKKQVEGLERKLGSIEGRSGVLYNQSILEENLRKLSNQVDEILYPPRRSRVTTLTGLEEITNPNLEQMVQAAVQKFVSSRTRETEERLERIEGRFRKLVTEEDFEESDKQRAQEIAEVRTTLAEVRGILKGLQSALGIVRR